MTWLFLLLIILRFDWNICEILWYNIEMHENNNKYISVGILLKWVHENILRLLKFITSRRLTSIISEINGFIPYYSYEKYKRTLCGKSVTSDGGSVSERSNKIRGRSLTLPAVTKKISSPKLVAHMTTLCHVALRLSIHNSGISYLRAISFGIKAIYIAILCGWNSR